MKKTKIYSLVLCLFLFGSSAFAANYYNKPRLSFSTFDNKTGVNVPVYDITEMMTTELYDSGLFTLVDREILDYTNEEIKLGMSGLVDPATAPKVRMAYSMTGAVSLYHYNNKAGVLPISGIRASANTGYVTLDIRIVNTVTSEVVYASAETGSANREESNLVSWYSGFDTGPYGGILASATYDAVMKHVKSMEEVF